MANAHIDVYKDLAPKAKDHRQGQGHILDISRPKPRTWILALRTKAKD